VNIKKISALQAILLALAITGLINGVIFSYQTDGVTGINVQDSEYFFPSSKVIGSVWTFLVACLAFSFSRVVKQNTILAAWIFGLFLVCILYPIYTFGFSSLPNMILGNLLTIALASFISGALLTYYKLESFLTFLVPVWVSFVSYLMFVIN
jgi:tryptophan-rich sensory protein